jgi:alpha-N-arabinofuranosidase
VGLERQLRAMKRQIDSSAGRGKVQVAFTEWLFSGPSAQAPMYNNLGGALATAGFLNTLMRVADFTPVSDMTGLIEFGGIWQKNGVVYGVPAYWAFRMYSNADATRLVETRTKGPQYDVEQGVKRLPAIRSVPYLDVVAVLNDAGSRLTLFCVNRGLSREIEADIRIAGFAPASARAQRLAAADLYAANDDAQPDAVKPVPVGIRTAASGFRHVFPAKSVTVIELSR